MKKQYLAKRLFALILAVSVCAAAIPVPVRAEETTASQETDVSEETAASEEETGQQEKGGHHQHIEGHVKKEGVALQHHMIEVRRTTG